MKMNQYVDVLIPRGGAGLIRAVVNQATIPVIETGTGNCHIFVDETADFDMAVNIIMNAKTQRIGVCNACESLVIHEKIVDTFMPKLTEALQKKNVELHADERSFAAAESDTALNRALIKPAVEEDWGKEYLDYMISAKTVASVDEAIEHINRYNTGQFRGNHYRKLYQCPKVFGRGGCRLCLCQCIDSFLMDSSLALVRRSVSVRRSFMREVRWA